MKEQKVINESVGVDVSKHTLDAYLHDKGIHVQVTNDQKGFKSLLKWIKNEVGSLQNIIICFEHTGWYCVLFSQFLHENKLYFSCVNPMVIRRSLALNRHKTDKQDARDIARFAWLRREELTSSLPMPIKLIELQRLMSMRDQLVKQSTALKNLKKAMMVTTVTLSSDTGIKLIDQTIKHLEGQIKKAEIEMEDLIRNEEDLERNYKLSQTVKGVGRILGIQMLLHTHNYTRFENCRQFSAYCGLAPFQYQSGTSIKRRPRTYSFCDKKMKGLLTLSSISAIQADKELKLYFTKRVEEGKPKMLVLNIIRNKIVSRIFATVKRGTPFVELGKFAG